MSPIRRRRKDGPRRSDARSPDVGQPDITLALALVHHLVISANVPLPALLQWLSQNTRESVIEFISKDDPMVRRLLLNKDDTYADYQRDAFEVYLQRCFRVKAQVELPGGQSIPVSLSGARLSIGSDSARLAENPSATFSPPGRP